MDVNYVIPAPPDDPSHGRFRNCKVLGHAETNIYDAVVSVARPVELVNRTDEDFIGGLTAYQYDDGTVDFSSYSIFDPSNWERTYDALRDQFAEELVARGLCSMDQMEHLQ